MAFSVYEELSLLDSEYGESGREGYMPKVEHCEKLGSNLNKGCDAYTLFLYNNKLYKKTIRISRLKFAKF